MKRFVQVVMLAAVLPVMADISDGPDVQKNERCIVVDVVVDGEMTQYIVPNGPGRMERFQKQLFDNGHGFGKAVSMVNQLSKGLSVLESNRTKPKVKEDEPGLPKPNSCCDGRDEIGPPIDCFCGQRPFNCTHCLVIG